MKIKIILLISITIIISNGYAQKHDSFAVNFNKYEIITSLLLKKNSPYAESYSENTKNKYKLSNSLSTQFDLLLAYNLNLQIKLYSGVGIAGNDYEYEFDFRNANHSFKLRYQIGITSFKFPFRIGFKVNNHIELLGGISVNFNQNGSYSVKTEYDNSNTDTTMIIYKIPTSENFPSFKTISANVGINFYTNSRFRFFVISDFDFNYYPSSTIITSITINNIKNDFNLSGKSKFYYFSGGVSYMIFKNRSH